VCNDKKLCKKKRNQLKTDNNNENNENNENNDENTMEDVEDLDGRPRSCTMKYAEKIINVQETACKNKIKEGIVQTVYSYQNKNCYLFNNKKILQMRIRGGKSYKTYRKGYFN
jgi:hypothetical protein